jgi:hypothetical protein
MFWCNLVQSGATTALNASLTNPADWHLNGRALPWQALRCAVNDEAHVIEPQPGATKPALTANHGGARLDIFETEN